MFLLPEMSLMVHTYMGKNILTISSLMFDLSIATVSGKQRRPRFFLRTPTRQELKELNTLSWAEIMTEVSSRTQVKTQSVYFANQGTIFTMAATMYGAFISQISPTSGSYILAEVLHTPDHTSSRKQLKASLLKLYARPWQTNSHP